MQNNITALLGRFIMKINERSLFIIYLKKIAPKS